MQGIGEILRKTRESKGITLEEVSEATKIRSKYLEAIEHEEFQLLPGEIYAKGFVSTYLKYLGIKDQPEVVAILQTKPKEPEMPVVVEGEQKKEAEQQTRVSRKNKQQKNRSVHSTRKKMPAASFEEKPLSKKSSLIIILSVAAVILLLALQWFYTKSLQDELPQDPVQQEEQQNPDTEQDGTNPPDDQTEPEVPQEPVVPVYQGLEMHLEILNTNANAVDQCWMQIVADGQKTETTMSEGDVQDIQATDSIRLKLGNAGVVKITLNGQDLGTLGSQGQVVQKEFKAEDYVTSAQ